MLADGTYPSRLAWFVEATNLALREYIWIDAHTGANLLNFSQLAHAKSRSVYTAGGGNVLPGTLQRSEGGPDVGDADADNAYLYSGTTYDYYLSVHGRDSFDNAGAALISTVHFDDVPGGLPYRNAFWNGTQMVYGDGYALADDVVAHELTHAVTERSARLLYWYQSGALNESMSDVFGETVDIETGNGTDTDAVRWLMGEDLPASIGVIRNMMTPTALGDPGKMSDPQFWCVTNGYTSPFGDSGGVHINSGIPNHAYALAVDGGSYNGRTVTGIGFLKAGKIWYRALTDISHVGRHVPGLVQRAQRVLHRSDRHQRDHRRRLHAGHDRPSGRRDEPGVGLRRCGAGAGSLSFGNTDDRVFRWRRSSKRGLDSDPGTRYRRFVGILQPSGQDWHVVVLRP